MILRNDVEMQRWTAELAEEEAREVEEVGGEVAIAITTSVL